MFDQVLAALEKENSVWAELLRYRFWDGKQAQAMIMRQEPRPWSESYFFEQQSLAVDRFTAILNELEGRCRLNQGRAASRSISHRSGHNPLITITALAIILVFAWSVYRYGPPPNSPGEGVAEILVTPPTPRAACGELSRATSPAPPLFFRHQGVSSFTAEGTRNLVQNNKVRAVAIDKRGLWTGFFATEENPENGLAHYDKQTWSNCDFPAGTSGKDVNDIAIDPQGRIWVAAEKRGVAMYDGVSWRTFTEKDGLPSADTFGLTIDPQGAVWVSTWDGVATFDGKEWSTPFTTQNDTLASDHAHAIAFDSVGDIWIGLIHQGISRRRHTDGSWVHITKEDGSLSGNEVRAILVRPQKGDAPESVWIATNDGGISVYERGGWFHHTADTGLPNNVVNDLALDRYNRVWAATGAGVAYLVGDTWTTYTTLPSLSIAIGADCPDCPYDSDHVLVGTLHNGITHSRLPLDTSAVEVLKEVYPKVVAPGERFVPEITIAPKAPYKLDSNRGDFLSNTDEDDSLLFGTHEHIAVKGVIEAGAAFTFREPDLPFIAPDLPDGVAEKTYTSTWRMWMHTRYVGPPIHITFTVRR